MKKNFFQIVALLIVFVMILSSCNREPIHEDVTTSGDPSTVTDATSDVTTDAPTDAPTEAPTDEPTDAPTDETTEPPIEENTTEGDTTEEDTTEKDTTEENTTEEDTTEEDTTEEDTTEEDTTEEDTTEEGTTACTHDWDDADCDTPKTCSKCHTTEGGALGHNWSDADCNTPKTCSRCQATEGGALGHNWSDAYCDTPKTCSRCQATDGDALGHLAVTDAAVKPNCTETGLTEGSHCGRCNAVILAQTTIPANGHKYDNDSDEECNNCGFVRNVSCTHTNTVKLDAVAETCTGTGLTEGKKCTDCEEILIEQKSIPALGHNWSDADCDTPKTCSRCQVTEGNALGHNWSDADCYTPKTCSRCQATEGNALGHNWSDADCDTPKTCSRCQATEGNALGHAWSNADCTTPKTCSRCQATEGNALGHAWSNADCITPKTCSRCKATDGNALGHAWSNADCTTPKTCSRCQATEGNALGHNYVNGTCSRCGKAEQVTPPPVDSPADKPVNRTEHSPYEYFHCGSCGYVAYNDAANIAGSISIDCLNPQGNTDTNYFAGGFAYGKVITLAQPQNGYFDISGWVGIDANDYTLGWSIGSDDLRWWSYSETKITASNGADPAVLAAANSQGYRNASRFTYTLPWISFTSGDTIHLLVKDNANGLIYCFGEFKVIKNNETAKVGTVRLDSVFLGAEASGTDYKSKVSGSVATLDSSDSIYYFRGWVPTSISNCSLVWRRNEELVTWACYKVTRPDDAAIKGVCTSEGYSSYVAYVFQLGTSTLNNGDNIHFYLKDNDTGALYQFASYTVKIKEPAGKYNLLNTVSKYDPVTNKETATAPYDDANLKMWFDHLTEKMSRYDTSKINSTNSSYTIQMARNEIEGCHFYLYHPQNKKVTIKISDFKNEYGETLETELGVEFYIRDSLLTDKGMYEGQKDLNGQKVVGVYPDAVVPYESYIKGGYGDDEGGNYQYGAWVPIGPYSFSGTPRAAIRGFTVQAKTSKNSRPGQYVSTIEIYDAETGKCIKKANVYTYVYDVVLNDEPALDTYIGMWYSNYETTNNHYGIRSQEAIVALANFMLDYRMTPAWGGWAYDSYFGAEWCYNPRVTTIRANKDLYNKWKNDPVLKSKFVYYGQDEPGVPRNQWRPITLENGTSTSHFDQYGILSILGVAEEAKMLQSWGWNDYRLLIPFERNPNLKNLSSYPNIQQNGTMNLSWNTIKAALTTDAARAFFAKYESEITSSRDMVEFLSNYVTVWVYTYTGSTPRGLSSTAGCRYMQDASYDAVYGEFFERMRKYQAEGDELWGYVACEPQWDSPYQNILLFNDGTEARTMFWTSYKLGQTGWLYWREDYYATTSKTTTVMSYPWSVTGPGDGILLYPGGIYGQVDPIPSIRFMNMRDGIEDYELLCMLEEKYGEAKAMEMVNNIVTSTVTFTRDDQKVYDVHAQILKLLAE